MSDRAPDMLFLLRQVTEADPERFRHAHREGDSRRYEWIEACAAACHAVDARFGLNGKRGNPNDISMDVITFKVGADDRMVQAFDVCGSCGGDGAHAKWDDITNWKTIGEANTAIWVKPPSVAANPLPPAVSVRWTGAHAAMLARLLETGRPSASGDRAFVVRVAQQFAHSFPGEGWGTKRAAAGRAVSDDILARQMDGRLYGYRIVPATTTPTELDITGQLFEPVPSVNHLHVVVEPIDPVDPVRPEPVGPQPPVPAPVNLAPVLDEIHTHDSAVRVLLESLSEKVNGLEARVIACVKGQSYDIDASAGYLGKVRGTIKPRE